jgi:hypothetical protein
MRMAATREEAEAKMQRGLPKSRVEAEANNAIGVPKTQAEAETISTDMIAKMAYAKILEDYTRQSATKVEPSKTKVKNPTVFVIDKDTVVALAGSGPYLVRARTEISSGAIISALKEAKVELRPVR